MIDLPSVEVKQLEDGCVEVRLGDQVGVVSSYHLVEPKVNQLMQAWLRVRAEEVRGDG